MHARMNNPGFLVPDALKALQAFGGSCAGRLPKATVEMVNLRASQINGCSVCVEMHARALRQQGLPEEKVFAIAAWRESPYFSDEERAALGLAEALTRIADRPDAVSDEVWDEAARLYDESALAALVLSIAAINTWNRLNVAVRQVAGPWTAQATSERPEQGSRAA
jgi:AhpD family alkylhydroperoxidase